MEQAPRRRDGRATRWDAHRQDRRRAIIQAAVDLIESDGPDALTGQIAQRAGVPRTHVYRHFADKDALDRAVVEYAIEQVTEQVNFGLASEGSVLDIARAAIGGHVQWMVDHPNLNRFIDRHSLRSAHGNDANTAFAIGLTSLLESYLGYWRVSPKPAEPLAVGIVGMVEATVLWWLRGGLHHDREGRELGHDELVEMLVRQVWVLIDHVSRDVGITLDPDQPLPVLTG
jgi:AcrR family transcriptional regulator